MVIINEGDVKILRYSELNESYTVVVELEGLSKRRKKWTVEMEEVTENVGQDPVEKLGSDLMRKICGLLDARDLARVLVVSKSWFHLSSSDSLWSPLCDQLWIGKAHIPRWSKVPGLSKIESYSRAVNDSKRVRVMKEDLWDHAWDFHFTETAPNYWKDLDPYWGRVGPPMHRYFHPDGSVTADPDDIVWGGHECCYTIVTGLYSDGKIRENYVRINRWPRLTVSRRKDWGWEMSNFVCAYSSVPDPFKEGGTGPMFNCKDRRGLYD